MISVGQEIIDFDIGVKPNLITMKKMAKCF